MVLFSYLMIPGYQGSEIVMNSFDELVKMCNIFMFFLNAKLENKIIKFPKYYEHAKSKIRFLEKHLDKIACDSERIKASKNLNKYREFIKRYSLHTQV